MSQNRNELHGLTLECLPSELNIAGQCPETSGHQVIERLGLDYITITQAAWLLVLYIFMTRLIAFLGLRYIKW